MRTFSYIFDIPTAAYLLCDYFSQFCAFLFDGCAISIANVNRDIKLLSAVAWWFPILVIKPTSYILFSRYVFIYL